MEATYRESVLDLKQIKLRVVSQCATETSAAENSVLYKSYGTKITHRGVEKGAWKQTIRNSKVLQAGCHSCIQGIVAVFALR